MASAELSGVRQRVRDEPAHPTWSRLDSLPLVSRVAGMLRGLRFNVASQRLEEDTTTPGDDDVTNRNDVNDNEKSRDDDDDDDDDSVSFTFLFPSAENSHRSPAFYRTVSNGV